MCPGQPQQISGHSPNPPCKKGKILLPDCEQLQIQGDRDYSQALMPDRSSPRRALARDLGGAGRRVSIPLETINPKFWFLEG